MSGDEVSTAVVLIRCHLVHNPRQSLPGSGMGLWLVLVSLQLFIFFYVFFAIHEDAKGSALGTCGFIPFWARSIISFSETSAKKCKRLLAICQAFVIKVRFIED